MASPASMKVLSKVKSCGQKKGKALSVEDKLNLRVDTLTCQTRVNRSCHMMLLTWNFFCVELFCYSIPSAVPRKCSENALQNQALDPLD
jgi:hypothetical protein